MILSLVSSSSSSEEDNSSATAAGDVDDATATVPSSTARPLCLREKGRGGGVVGPVGVVVGVGWCGVVWVAP